MRKVDIVKILAVLAMLVIAVFAVDKHLENLEEKRFGSSDESTTITMPNTTTEATTETTTEPPLVSYADIESGTYNNSVVKVEGVVSNVEKNDLISNIEFSVWFNNNGNLTNSGTWFLIKDDIGASLFNYLNDNLNEGDNCLFTVGIHKDGSFGGSSLKDAVIIDSATSLDEIKQTYIENCTYVSVSDLARNPAQYKGTDVVLNGEVFQIANETESRVEFLFDTGEDNGIVYISYNFPEGSGRLLEGDKLTIYGTFYIMRSYTSVLGTKQNVPSISALFIE